MNKPGQSPTVANLKIRRPCRDQIEFRMSCLDDLIPQQHKARRIWEFISEMDTSVCYELIKSTEGEAGRKASDPVVLFALWILAITDGITSGRRIVELCKYHDAYRWVAGNVAVNRTMLCDFRSKNPQKFRKLLVESLAVMKKAGLLDYEDLTQDGTKIRVRASRQSAHRENTLSENLQEASEYVEQVEKESREHEKSRSSSAKARGARDRLEKIQQALAELKLAREEKKQSRSKQRKKTTPEDLQNLRVSETDPEARKMKFKDGSYHLAYNAQVVTGMKSRTIQGIDVSNGQDPGTAEPLMTQVHTNRKMAGLPAATALIYDSAYGGQDDINACGVLFPEIRYISPPKRGLAEREVNIDPRRTDSEHMSRWRENLRAPDFLEKYALRMSTAEFSNAQLKNHGLILITLKGIAKAVGMVSLHSIAHNFSRALDLGMWG